MMLQKGCLSALGVWRQVPQKMMFWEEQCRAFSQKDVSETLIVGICRNLSGFVRISVGGESPPPNLQPPGSGLDKQLPTKSEIRDENTIAHNNT